MFLVLAFLWPVAMYTLALGLINRRRTPLLVPGTWDFVGLLFGVSGFILAGSAFVLTSLSRQWRDFWLFGSRRYLRDLDASSYSWMIYFTIGYGILIVAGVALLLRRRRAMTLIYNVEPAVFEEVLSQVLESKGLSWKRAGKRLLISMPADNAGGENGAASARSGSLAVSPLPAAVRAAPGLAAKDLLVVLDLESAWMMHNVTLRWHASGEPAVRTLREEIESDLRKTLAVILTETNSMGGWLLTLSAILFVAVFAILVALLLLAMAGPHALP